MKRFLLLTTLVLSACCNSKNQFYTITNEAGMYVVITNYGARIQSIQLKDKDGMMRDVVLGFDTVEDYYLENHSSDFGAAIGRYANRIKLGKFTLDGMEYSLPINNEPNSLHGGPTGWQYQAYQLVNKTPNSLKFKIVSPNGDNNYPGKVTAFVTYTLTEDNKIDIEYEATSDAPTIINMTNHSYFNLAGDPANSSCTEDILYLNSSYYTPIDETFIPTGEFAEVDEVFDFRTAHKVGDYINYVDNQQIKYAKGYDHNWILDSKGDINTLACELYSPKTGINLQVYTTEPGVQVYTGNFLDGTVEGKGGIVYPFRSAICLETQHYPDSPNHPEWPSVVLRPGETYRSRCIYAFSIK